MEQVKTPAFYAKVVGDFLIVETNERTLPLYGTVSVTLPSEIKLAFCKDESEACATLTSESGYLCLTTINKSLEGKKMEPQFCAKILLEIRDFESPDADTTLYLCDVVS